jgi:hypothetical protein
VNYQRLIFNVARLPYFGRLSLEITPQAKRFWQLIHRFNHTHMKNYNTVPASANLNEIAAIIEVSSNEKLAEVSCIDKTIQEAFEEKECWIDQHIQEVLDEAAKALSEEEALYAEEEEFWRELMEEQYGSTYPKKEMVYNNDFPF